MILNVVEVANKFLFGFDDNVELYYEKDQVWTSAKVWPVITNDSYWLRSLSYGGIIDTTLMQLLSGDYNDFNFYVKFSDISYGYLSGYNNMTNNFFNKHNEEFYAETLRITETYMRFNDCFNKTLAYYNSRKLGVENYTEVVDGTDENLFRYKFDRDGILYSANKNLDRIFRMMPSLFVDMEHLHRIKIVAKADEEMDEFTLNWYVMKIAIVVADYLGPSTWNRVVIYENGEEKSLYLNVKDQDKMMGLQKLVFPFPVTLILE